MRIVFLVRALDVGGAERQLVNLAVGLSGRGHDVRVMSLYDDGPLAAELRDAGVDVVGSGKRGRWDMVGPIVRLARRLRAEPPQVVYGWLTAAHLLSVALRPALLGGRVVWGVRASDMELDRYGAFQSVNFALSCGLARFADAILCNSEAGLRFHVACGMPGDRMRVVANGIDTRRFAPDAEGGAALRSRWGVDGARPLIGLAARLDPMKDHLTFLEAARHFVDRRPEARFVCLGDGPEAYGAMLRRRADELELSGHVVWAGRVTAMPAAYSALDLATSSSAFGEGFPNVLGEAMACGTPCVATDVGDAARVLGDVGLVVPARRPRALAQAWDEAWRRRDAWAGEPVRRRVVETFSLDRMVDRSEALLVGLVGEPPA